jgi:hypothetical protein
MTAAVIGVTLAALVFLGAARHLWREAEFGDPSATVMFSLGIWLSIGGCLTLHRLAPTAPLWTFVVVALGGVPIASVPVLLAGLLGRQPTIAPVGPVGACQRCSAPLWDLAGNHRYTDHEHSFLCPPEHWQPGQHRLHQLGPASAHAESAGPSPADSVAPAHERPTGQTTHRRFGSLR